MSKNQRFSDVFRGYRNVTLDQNGLKIHCMKSVSVVPSVVPRSFFIFWYSICKKFISSRSTVSSKYRTFSSNSMCSCCISPFIFCCFSNLLPVITGGMIHLDILFWLVYVFYVFPYINDVSSKFI